MLSEQEIREHVAEILVLRNNPTWREQDIELIASGAVRNSQLGGSDTQELAVEFRKMCPCPMMLQADMETGSGFVEDGVELPAQMALGAAGSEDLAYRWGLTVGSEARRLGLDVIWSPVLDINTNPDNPIINIRSLGQSVDSVSRLGAAVVRGMIKSGIHPAAKHWPGHGSVAVDSHMSLPTVELDRERLESVEWAPYKACVEAGMESVMTGHLLIPAIDPDNCATVSPVLLELLRKNVGIRGVIFTDSLGMEGLRLTMDSAEAAWRAIAAGHSQVLVDYKRSPYETLEAVVEACLAGNISDDRLIDAANKVRALKSRLQKLPLEADHSETVPMMQRLGKDMARMSVTAAGPRGVVKLTNKCLLVVCDDSDRYGAGIADERQGVGTSTEHPLVSIVRTENDCETLVCDEEISEQDFERVMRKAEEAEFVVGATFAHILNYKGSGSRLPKQQSKLWEQLNKLGKLQGMMLFESPYALNDLPSDVFTVVAYGGDQYSLRAAVEAITGKIGCPGRLPVDAG